MTAVAHRDVTGTHREAAAVLQVLPVIQQLHTQNVQNDQTRLSSFHVISYYISNPTLLWESSLDQST